MKFHLNWKVLSMLLHLIYICYMIISDLVKADVIYVQLSPHGEMWLEVFTNRSYEPTRNFAT